MYEDNIKEIHAHINELFKEYKAKQEQERKNAPLVYIKNRFSALLSTILISALFIALASIFCLSVIISSCIVFIKEIVYDIPVEQLKKK